MHTLFIFKKVVSYQSWNTLRRRILILFIYKKVVSYQSWNTLRRHIHTLFIYKKVVSYQSGNTLRRHIHTLFIYKMVVSYQSRNTLRRHIHTIFIYQKVVSYQCFNTLRRQIHHPVDEWFLSIVVRHYSLKHCAKISPKATYTLPLLLFGTLVVSYQSWNTLRRHIHTIFIYQKVIQVFQIGANNHCGWVIFEHCFRFFSLKHCA